MKTKSIYSVVVSIICLALVVTMVLPMGVFAADEEETVKGFTFAEEYYESEWTGPNAKVNNAGYGSWVNGDGQYNGAWQWSSEKEKVTFDNTTGVLTFKETSNPSLKFHPGQISGKSLGEGACYITARIFFEEGTYEVDGEKFPLFSGVRFGYSPGSSDNIIYYADTDGKVYIGNSPNYNPPKIGQMEPGWNTFEVVILPKDKDGNVLESANGAKPSDVVDSTTVYVRVSSDANPAADTRAFTWDDLNNTSEWGKLASFNAPKGFYGGGAGGWGSSGYLKPVKSKGSFKLAGGKAIKLGVDQPITQVKYEGYPELTQAVPKGASDRVLTVPQAYISGSTTDKVALWYNAATDNFLTPGDIVTVPAESITYTIAAGDDLAKGELKSALGRVDLANLATKYNYEQLTFEEENIKAASLKAGLPSDHEYEQQKETILRQITARKNVIAQACGELIENVAIFGDDTADLASRADAFLYIKDTYFRIGVYGEVTMPDLDGTYSTEAAEAIETMNRFQQSWNSIEQDWLDYRSCLDEVDLADAGPAKNDLYAQIVESFLTIKRGFSSFELDPVVEMGYIENMDAMLEQFEELATLRAKFDYLSDWATSWNEFNLAMYRGRAEEVPTALLAAVKSYNNSVKAVNEEFVAAAQATVLIEQNCIVTEVGNAMISDIRSKVNRLVNENVPVD